MTYIEWRVGVGYDINSGVSAGTARLGRPHESNGDRRNVGDYILNLVAQQYIGSEKVSPGGLIGK